MPRETRFGVIEIGMNHAGEITPLTALARPHVAIITTVAPVHLEFFDSVEAIADAKAEIFRASCRAASRSSMPTFAHYERLDAAARAAGAGHIATFGAAPQADARLVDVETHETYADRHGACRGPRSDLSPWRAGAACRAQFACRPACGAGFRARSRRGCRVAWRVSKCPRAAAVASF